MSNISPSYAQPSYENQVNPGSNAVPISLDTGQFEIDSVKSVMLALVNALRSSISIYYHYMGGISKDVESGNNMLSKVRAARPGGTDVTKAAVFPNAARTYIQQHGRKFAGCADKDSNLAQADFDSNRSTLSSIIQQKNDDSQNAQTQLDSLIRKVQSSIDEIGTIIDKRNQSAGQVAGNI